MHTSKRRKSNIHAGLIKQRRSRKISMSGTLQEKVNAINEHWVNDTPLDTDNVCLKITPFKYCVLDNFIKDEEFLRDLKEELLDIQFVTKRNDLYQFHQSVDLCGVDKPYCNSLKYFLREECCSWLEDATSIKLNKNISTTCSSYKYSDHLLCHDDKCEDRRIAFVLYLNENWRPEHGGTLEMFDSDSAGQPNKVVDSVSPIFNSFVFFEVTCKSFHQVAEVKSLDRARISVNGWFHGPLPEEKTSTPCMNVTVPLLPPLKVVNDVLSCINKLYFESDVQDQISSSFEEDSEILLPNFFEDNFYNEVCRSLASSDLSWKSVGPANYRKYEILNAECLSSTLKELLKLMTSDQFFKLLGKVTQLDLSPESCENKSLPYCSYEVQRWKKGFYTLLRDDQDENYALDVILYFNVHKTEHLQGGFTSYIAHSADEELLTLVPTHNALALTFRDKETLRFVKYINETYNDSFHVLLFTYYESQSSAKVGEDTDE